MSFQYLTYCMHRNESMQTSRSMINVCNQIRANRERNDFVVWRFNPHNGSWDLALHIDNWDEVPKTNIELEEYLSKYGIV